MRNPLAAVRHPGSHEVVWDGTNDKGVAVPSGSYFYQLVIKSQGLASFSETRKMILVH